MGATGRDRAKPDPRRGVAGHLHELEEAATTASTRFRTIFEMSPVPIVLTRLVDGVIVDANPAFCAMTGYGREELLNRTATDVGLWRREDALEGMKRALHDTGAARDFETRIVARDGSERITRTFLQALSREPGGLLLRMEYDMTELRKADLHTRESEAKLRSLIESLHETVVVLDRDLRQVEVLGSSPRMPAKDA